MSQNPQVVQLLTDIAGSFIHSEALAAAATAIVPGMLVEETAAGTVQENSGAAAAAQKLFALSNLITAGDIDTPYAVGETVRYGAAHAGQEVYAWLADGETAVIGGALESDGAGALQALTVAAPGSTVAYALEAFTASGLTRIRARVA